ncbi:hypothetical protein EYC80_009092 [Monilinia laxa]|uniref:Uncharacterized protein n=1 Tax=Monilinia laxa TaxID=61186 RepID=A0A5N6K2G9_MONLA|nr:hypothetical protein EYC80_009092 [Monilinia laxa]
MHQLPEGPPPEAYLRLPSSSFRPRQNVSIRAPRNLSRQTSYSSSSQPAINVEKKPIPPYKLQRASKLYSEFRMKEGLAQRSPDPNATPPSSTGSFSASGLPGPLTNGSRSSKPSFDAVSEYSSVISFDTASQSSARSRRRNETISYQGNAVKQRTRKRLEPVARAKTALVRYLGACQHCKSRNVQCPLEHHDIESLECAHQLNSIGQEFDSECYNPTSPVREPQIENTHSGQATPVISHVHNEELVGIGSFFAPEVPLERELVFSPTAPDSLPEISFGHEDTHGLSAPISLDYSLIQNGCQFPLGVWDSSTYKCYFLDGDCQQYFADPEALQVHFETAHFEFTRIDPPLRCICTQCFSVNNNCSCSCGGPVKLFICGNYIQTTQYPPEPPTRQPYNYTEFNTPTVYPDLSYSYSDFEQGLGFNVDAAHNFENNYNARLYGNGSNIYPSPNVGGVDAYTYDSTQPGGNRYNGYAWTLTRGANNATAALIRYCVKRFRRTPKHQKSLMSILLFLILIVVSFQLCHWITSTIILKSDQFLPTLPTVGFIGLIISFITNWAARDTYSICKSRRCKLRQCPLHAFVPLANKYGQRIPPALMHARVS